MPSKDRAGDLELLLLLDDLDDEDDSFYSILLYFGGCGLKVKWVATDWRVDGSISNLLLSKCPWASQ